MLRLLQSILPSWTTNQNPNIQQNVVDHLFNLLGQVLLLCNTPFDDGVTKKKRKKAKMHTSLTASSSSTIAEEIVVLLRRLHPLPAWNKIVNSFIANSLQAVPELVLRSEEMGQKIAERSSQLTNEEQVTKDSNDAYYMPVS